MDNTLPIVNRVDQAYLTNYSNILNEIEEIGWEKLYCVNFNFTEIKLKMFDSKRNQHILTIKLNGSIPELFAEYPCHLNYEWHKVILYLSYYENGNLKNLIIFFFTLIG